MTGLPLIFSIKINKTWPPSKAGNGKILISPTLIDNKAIKYIILLIAFSKPNFVTLSTPADYKKYYIKKYCKTPLYTFDGIKVRFYEDQFEHAFYESSNKQKRNKHCPLFTKHPIRFFIKVSPLQL